MNPSFRLFEKASTAFSNNEVPRLQAADGDRRFAARKEIRRPKGRQIFHTPLREKYFRRRTRRCRKWIYNSFADEAAKLK